MLDQQDIALAIISAIADEKSGRGFLASDSDLQVTLSLFGNKYRLINENFVYNIKVPHSPILDAVLTGLRIAGMLERPEKENSRMLLITRRGEYHLKSHHDELKHIEPILRAIARDTAPFVGELPEEWRGV